MKLIVIRDNLKDAVFSVEKISKENQNLPILKNALFEALNNKLKITTTNLEEAITYSIACKVIESGKTTVPVSIFSGIINNLQTDRINLETKGNKLIVKTDNYEAEIQGLAADDFPITPKIENPLSEAEFKSETIKNALSKVLIASQFSDLRPELNSVFFNFFEEGLKIAATDSFRLAEIFIGKDHFNTKKNKCAFLVPLKTAYEFIRIVKNGETVKIYSDENQVLFKTGQFELLSRLSEGTFPEYEAIIPKKFITEAIINKQEFSSALKLAGVFGTRNGEVKIKSKDGKNFLEITSADQSVGENRYLLPAKTKGKQEEIVFNWKYLSDFLKAVDGEEVFFGINKENEPAALRQAGDDTYVYVLKPISGA